MNRLLPYPLPRVNVNPLHQDALVTRSNSCHYQQFVSLDITMLDKFIKST